MGVKERTMRSRCLLLTFGLLAVTVCNALVNCPASATPHQQLAGGYSNTHPADDTITRLLTETETSWQDHLKPMLLQAKIPTQVGHHFKVCSYTTQVVAGMNYDVVIALDRGTAHVKIFKPLPYTNNPPQVTSVSFQAAASTDPAAMYERHE